MSAGEAEKTPGYGSGGDEDWLYGDNHDDVDDAPADDDDDKKTETEIFSALVGDTGGANGVDDKGRNADSDTDSDDNLRVTISGIKAGCVQSTGAPASLKTSGTSCVSGTKVRGRSGALVVVDRVISTSALQVEDEVDEKPWRKPGADLSDYFNYGFSEDTWKTYCDKQRRLRMSLEFMSLGSSDKSTGSRDEGVSKPDGGKLKSSIDVIGGQTETIVRVEGRRHHSTDGSNTQVQPSPEPPVNAQPPSSKLPPFFANIPPPPFPLLSINPTPPFIQRPPRLSMSAPPPGFPFPPEVPAPLFTSGRAQSGGSYDSCCAPLYPFPAGVYPHALGHMPPWPGLSSDRTKLWKYYSCQDKERERAKDRERTRERERDREPKKEQERDRDQENTPSFPSRGGDKERASRHRDHSDRDRERHREHDREGREREERHRDRRHRERNERYKSSRSSSSRKRHSSDDAESHSRHRYKRSKRNKDSTDTESTD